MDSGRSYLPLKLRLSPWAKVGAVTWLVIILLPIVWGESSGTPINIGDDDDVFRFPTDLQGTFLRMLPFEGNVRVRIFKGYTQQVKLVPLDLWIHFSYNDPYCVEDLRYDYWWLKDGEHAKHCADSMRDRGCFTVSRILDDDHIKFSKHDVREHCLGLRGNRMEILTGHDPNWARLYTTKPLVENFFGALVLVAHRGR